MDFNDLFEMIKKLSGDKELVLGDMRKDNNKIYLELDLVPTQKENI